MSATLAEMKNLYHHKKRLELENDLLRAALKEIKGDYSKGTRAYKIASKALMRWYVKHWAWINSWINASSKTK